MAAIYVRVYNEQTGFILNHDEASTFCKGLVTWIDTQAKKDDFCAPSSNAGEPGAPCNLPSSCLIASSGLCKYSLIAVQDLAISFFVQSVSDQPFRALPLPRTIEE